ncbi:MAG TPA: DNA primase regulatory subunit PriL, partial [Candidatus Thermoplasmatota archaeon]|nr:DNA primase regulatory subunit PriL [Candidatus Thermoplasmatota archaeon]
MDLSRLARYPFLPEAAGYPGLPALEELLSDRVYAAARAKGRERVRLALEEAAVPAPPLTEASPPRELLEDVLSYLYARILVSALADPYVVRR